ncbi:MAG TPA: cupin domain-containing protein [Terracidiphilus sp.]|jgi:XRE family transcriptional regulator, regulator of sulfur utilization|nr:cupin domain-containing protein [Terracidiphilus sp.]
MKTLLCAIVFFFAFAIAAAQTTSENPLVTARVFDYDQMKVRTTPNGTESRMVFNGTLSTGEVVGARESMQPVGTVPPKLHRIKHSEFIVVQQGMLEFDHDGKAERAGPGSIIYVAYGTEHAVKNVGDGPAKYVIIQVGGDTKK